MPVKDIVFSHWDTVYSNGISILFSQISQQAAFSFHTLLSLILFLVSLSEIGILAAAVGGACCVILILLGIFVAVRFYRRKRMENDIELHPREHEWNDPTVW